MSSNSHVSEAQQVIDQPTLGKLDHLLPPCPEAANDTFKLKSGCEFFSYDGGHDKQEFIIRTPDKRQYKISALSKEILERLDGKKSLDEIARELQSRSVNITGEELYQFLIRQYGGLKIFDDSHADPDEVRGPAAKKRKPLPLLFHWSLIPEKAVAWVAARLQFLYHRAAVVPGLALVIAAHYAVYVLPHAHTRPSNSGSLWVLLLSLVSVLFHEWGHAAALSRFGGSPGPVGFGLYLLLPTFYADVSEVWRFRRAQRMVVDVGGVYFQQLCFAAFAALSLYTGRPEFLVTCYFIDLMTLFNLNPIFRFDGYWLLVDYLALPNLYRQATRFFWYRIRKLLGGSPEPVSLPRMRGGVYAIFLLYAALCNVFLVFAVWASYNYLSTTVARLPRLYPQLFQSIAGAVAAHDPVLLLNLLVTLFFAIAFPGTALLGLFKYASLIVNRCVSMVHAYRFPSHT